MGTKSKLLIVEFMLPEGNVFHVGKLTAMIMLAVPGGEERTAEEYRELLGGWVLAGAGAGDGFGG